MHRVSQPVVLLKSPEGFPMLKEIGRQASRSQRWQSASRQEEPLLDRAMKGDPTACSILGGLLLVGVFVVAYKLLK
jgi:hypothetical protein